MKKAAISVVMIVISVMMFAGCGNDSPPAAQGDEDVFEITVGAVPDFFAGETRQEMMRMIEEHTNTRITWVPYASHDVLPVLIASGDLPMVMSIGGSQNTMAYLVDALRTGVFWDLTDKIPQFENLNRIHQQPYRRFTVNNRIFGIPREIPTSREAIGFRRDWLRDMGLEEPQTFYDVHNMILAFAENTPDGVYGVTHPPLMFYSVWATGVFNWGFDEEAGEMVHVRFMPQAQEALLMVRELFERGAIPPEFPLHGAGHHRDLWMEGRAGVFPDHSDFSVWTMQDPNADIGVGMLFPSTAGTFAIGAGGDNGGMYISRSAVQDEETVLRILEFLDRLGDVEMYTLITYGREGVHYDLVDGIIIPREDIGAQTDFLNNVSPLGQTVFRSLRTSNWVDIPVQRTYLQQRAIDVINENAPYQVFDASVGLTSQTMLERGGDLSMMLLDADVRFVMGAINWQEYEAILENWRRMGGDDIIRELTEAYLERRNNR